MTKFKKNALQVIRDNPGITAGELALKLWPKSLMHGRVSNQGNGACRGKAAWLSGGSYANKLRKQGFVRDGYVSGSYARAYWITDAGREAAK